MTFIPGLQLSKLFYEEAVLPILNRHYPQLPHSAAHLGWGSDVLGFDTAMSMDHGWGPKVTLFLQEADCLNLEKTIHQVLADELPFEVHGFPTHFGGNMSDGGKIELTNKRPINHMVDITTPQRFFAWYLGVDVSQPLKPEDWLTIPQQRLRTVASGSIHHDGLGTLSAMREGFAWYPHDVWLYMLACQWQHIDQEEPFIGRTGDVGDALGSQLLTAQLIRDLMRIAFLMEKQYAPYNKWFGYAFSQLKLSRHLLPLFTAALSAQTWQQRQQNFAQACLMLANYHNTQAITAPVAAEISHFYTRPFMVIHASRFVEALRAEIKDEGIKALPLVGSVDQFVFSVDVLENNPYCQALRGVYNAG